MHSPPADSGDDSRHLRGREESAAAPMTPSVRASLRPPRQQVASNTLLLSHLLLELSHPQEERGQVTTAAHKHRLMDRCFYLLLRDVWIRESLCAFLFLLLSFWWRCSAGCERCASLPCGCTLRGDVIQPQASVQAGFICVRACFMRVCVCLGLRWRFAGTLLSCCLVLRSPRLHCSVSRCTAIINIPINVTRQQGWWGLGTSDEQEVIVCQTEQKKNCVSDREYLHAWKLRSDSPAVFGCSVLGSVSVSWPNHGWLAGKLFSNTDFDQTRFGITTSAKLLFSLRLTLVSSNKTNQPFQPLIDLCQENKVYHLIMTYSRLIDARLCEVLCVFWCLTLRAPAAAGLKYE